MQNDAVQRMKALEFLVGEWHLDYTYRQGGETRRDLVGSGTLRPILDDRYLAFDYQVRNRESGKSGGSAHGVLAWDPKGERYRYFWFESSGAFLPATGELRAAGTLFLDWEGVDCTQTFTRVDDDHVVLEMGCPEQDLHLRVDMSRRAES